MKEKVFVFVLLMLAISCAPAPTPTSLPPNKTPVPPTATSVPPTATPVPPTATPRLPTPTVTPWFGLKDFWRIYTVGIDRSAPHDGWTTFNVFLAFENVTDQWLHFQYRIANAVVFTREGYYYVPDNYRQPNMMGGPSSNAVVAFDPMIRTGMIPPSFRARGVRECLNDCIDFSVGLTFDAAATSHPTRIELSADNKNQLRLQDVDLTATAKIAFPTSKPRSSFKNFGDKVNLRNKATLTVVRNPNPRFSDAKEGDWRGVSAYMSAWLVLENLDPGYAVKYDNDVCATIGGSGIVNPYRIHIAAGPAQTSKTEIGIFLPQSDKTFENGKFYCYGDPSFVFNLD